MSEQPPDDSVPRPPYNPYAQPDAPSTQPLWQGTQAPEQGWSAHPDAVVDAGGHRRLIVLVVVLLTLVAGAAITAAVLLSDDDNSIAVGDLEAGKCFDADNLAGGPVDSILEADCADEHDAEVFVTLEFGAGESIEDAGERCVTELAGLGVTWADLDEDGIEVRPLAADGGESEGDKVVCFIRSRDGTPLSGSEFE